MSASNSENARPRPPPGFLARIPVSELKLIEVTVRRNNITTSGSPRPIERNIGDPKAVIPLIHLRKEKSKDDAQRPKHIFDHEGVVVNQEERLDWLTDANQFEAQRRRSKSHGRTKSRSPRRARSRSSNYRRRSRSSSKSVEIDKDRRRVLDTTKSLDRRSFDDRRSEERDRRHKDREYLRERENDRVKRRSMTPLMPGEYRPSHPDLRRRSRYRGRKYSHDRNRSHSRSSRSLSRDRPKTSRKSPPTSRKASHSPGRSSSPIHRSKSPRYGDGRRGRRSRSPAKVDKPYYSEKRREKSPAYKIPDKRRSRSPPQYDKDRRRSRSPYKYSEGGRRASPGKSRTYSRSPGRYESRKSPPNKRKSSRSPHRPPIVSFTKDRPGYRRSNRLPGYERERGYHRRGSRSRSPKKRRSRSPHAAGPVDYTFYEGLPGAEYWIPGPMRPGFPGMPRFYQPGFYPRPIILQPRFPLIAPYQYPRQRLPVYNSMKKPKITDQTPSESGGTGAVTEPSAVADTSTNWQRNVIQEVVDTDTRKNDSADKRNVDEESRDSSHEKD